MIAINTSNAEQSLLISIQKSIIFQQQPYQRSAYYYNPMSRTCHETTLLKDTMIYLVKETVNQRILQVISVSGMTLLLEGVSIVLQHQIIAAE